MTTEKLLLELYHLSFTAGMNRRYYQAKLASWKKLDNRVQIAVAMCAVVGFTLSILSLFNLPLVNPISVVVAIFSLLAAIVLNVVPTGEECFKHGELYRRWNELHEDIESLEFRARHAAVEQVDPMILDRFGELRSKKTRIEQDEPLPDEALVGKCYEAENLARTGFANPEEKRLHDSQSRPDRPAEPQASTS
jgi:hypothetical protein